MEGCILIGGLLSDGSLRRWRPISVRLPFWRDRLVSSRFLSSVCRGSVSINEVVLSPTRSSYCGWSAVDTFWLDLVVLLGTSDFGQLLEMAQRTQASTTHLSLRLHLSQFQSSLRKLRAVTC